MSHELIFLPRFLGQSWADAFDGASNAAELDDPVLAAHAMNAWGRIVLRAVALLGPGSSYRGRRQGEFIHAATRSRLVFHGGDGILSIPYWLDDRAAIDLFGRIPAFVRAVHDETDLDAFCPRRGRGVNELTVTELVADYRVCRAEMETLLGSAAGIGTITAAGAVAPERCTARGTRATTHPAAEPAGPLQPVPPPALRSPALPPPAPRHEALNPAASADRAASDPAASNPPVRRRPAALPTAAGEAPASWDVPPAPPMPVQTAPPPPPRPEPPMPMPRLPRPLTAPPVEPSREPSADGVPPGGPSPSRHAGTAT